MKHMDERIARTIEVLGWILVCVGAVFTVWAFISFMTSSGVKLEPLLMLFFIGLIFCSIASGMFFVVLAIIIRTLKSIERNTDTSKTSNCHL